MTSNCSENSVDSPNILDHLNKFRYKRNTEYHSINCNDSQNEIQYTPKRDQKLSHNETGLHHVPETPESDLPSPASPVIRPSYKKRTCRVLHSEESELEDVTKVGSFKMEKDTSEDVCDEKVVNSGKRVHIISSSEDESPFPPVRKPKRFRLLSQEDEDDDKGSSTELGSSDVAKIVDGKSFSVNLTNKKEPSKLTVEKRGVVFVSDESDNESASRNEHDGEPKECKRISFHKSNVEKEKKIRSSKKGVIFSSSESEDENDDISLNNEVYNSDDSDFDQGDNHNRDIVLDYLNSSSLEELLRLPGCKKNKALTILELRPFTSWQNLVFKLKKAKNLTPDLLNVVFKFIQMQKTIVSLMNRCEKISRDIEVAVCQLKEGKYEVCLTEQPRSLNSVMHLAPHQLLGLNWLILMHHKKLNGILADEMGLGKTVQAIAFLTYLFDEGHHGPHLIVVPSSTLDNWVRELNKWNKHLKVVTYSGSQEERRYIRHQILRGEDQDVNVIVTTYNVVMSNAEDRIMIKSILFHYVVFDEAHMLKNINSQRYKNLMKIKADHRMLLTGTPMQNNLAELMSLLIFVMPKMFDNKVDEIRKMFSVQKNLSAEGSRFDQERIEQAKQIMNPFVLRRLKIEVLQDLPKKTERVERCCLNEDQEVLYNNLVAKLSRQIKDNKSESKHENMMMQLRKLANHPLLMRFKYTDNILKTMAKKMLKEPTHRDANPDLIFEDMQVMSDFELHRLCKMYRNLDMHQLSNEAVLGSGKFQYLDRILDSLKDKGSRILLFSQFTTMLDVLEEYLAIRNHSFLRLDGSTNVKERQELVDRYNSDSSIFIFLLSTKAGGLGINLTSANVVILHDIDFNPYNDKQAEDRCHRMGQTREVTIIRLLTKNTIEELMLRCATDKLQLQQKLTTAEDESGRESKVLISLLQAALNLK